jgi:hypothetical protein
MAAMVVNTQARSDGARRQHEATSRRPACESAARDDGQYYSGGAHLRAAVLARARSTRLTVLARYDPSSIVSCLGRDDNM